MAYDPNQYPGNQPHGQYPQFGAPPPAGYPPPGGFGGPAPFQTPLYIPQRRGFNSRITLGPGIVLNPHGVFGFVAVLIMVGVAFILRWQINWWYFVLAILLYSIAIITGTLSQEDTHDQDESFQLFRVLLGSHIAFIFLAGGLLLNPSNFFVQVGIFLAAVAAGMAMPFLLLRKS